MWSAYNLYKGISLEDLDDSNMTDFMAWQKLLEFSQVEATLIVDLGPFVEIWRVLENHGCEKLNLLREATLPKYHLVENMFNLFSFVLRKSTF